MLSIGTTAALVPDVGFPQNSEGVAVATPLISVPKDAVLALIVAMGSANSYNGATSFTWNIRRGATIAGALINTTGAIAGAPTLLLSYVLMGVDTIINFAQVQYVLTGVGVGMAGSGTFHNGIIGVIFLM